MDYDLNSTDIMYPWHSPDQVISDDKKGTKQFLIQI